MDDEQWEAGIYKILSSRISVPKKLKFNNSHHRLSDGHLLHHHYYHHCHWRPPCHDHHHLCHHHFIITGSRVWHSSSICSRVSWASENKTSSSADIVDTWDVFDFVHKCSRLLVFPAKKGFEANSNNSLCKCCWNNLILRGGQSELASEEGDVRAGGGQVLLVPADHVHRQDEKILVSTQEVAVVLLRCGDWVSWQCPPRWKISPAHNHGSPPSCWRTSQSCLTKVKVVFLSVDSSLIWRKTR